MYIPASFQENDIKRLHELMKAHPLGLLLTSGANGIQASPIPFLLYPNEGTYGVLRAHIARANPHWKELSGVAQCLVIFQGPEGYVTPSWYPSKAESHKVVPTWNYSLVQARGTPSVIDDARWLRKQLNDLTNHHEEPRWEPWSVDDAPEDFIVNQMKAIVGIEIPIERIEGKFKMSQNRSIGDRTGVLEGIGNPEDPHCNLEVAGLVRAYS